MAADGGLAESVSRLADRDLARRHVAALAAAALLLYTFGLSWAPVFLHFDEIKFAEQARSIAATGRDVNGRFLPLYFQMEASVWFHPLGVYLPAIAFKLWTVSIAALRAPTALLGVLDVVLVYGIARRMFGRHRPALVAGALLATAPAHFLLSRMAVDYLFPAPFALGWCVLFLRSLDTRSHRTLFAATSMLGLGCYSYIAAVALMPLFLAVTVLLLWREDWTPGSIAVALAGFAWPLIPAALFISTHQEMLASTLGRYGIEANQLDALQRVRETLTPWFLSDRANLYFTFFSPGYLFVTGGGGLVGSTRTAGVFLACTLPLMLIGFRATLLRYSPSSTLLLAGVLLPPVAGAIVNEPFSISRTITMVPFAMLMAVLGIEQLRGVRPPPVLARVLRLGGYAAIGVGAVYLIYRGVAGDLTPGGLAVVVLGVAAIALAYAIRRSQTFRPVVAALLLACAWQFSTFTLDYFGDYRVRSAIWFNGNLKGAVTRIVAEIDQAGGPRPEVLLDQYVSRIDWYWRFHLAELGRSDLEPLQRVVTREQMQTLPLAPGTLILFPAMDDTLRALVESRGMTLVASITDPGDDLSGPGPGERPSYFLFKAR
jgi:4-amino-4-deoxy-L-arabinose transferase-like glycosyltransferase